MRASFLLIVFLLVAHTSTAQALGDERPACFRFDSGWTMVFHQDGSASLTRLHNPIPNWLLVNDRGRKQGGEKSEQVARAAAGTFDPVRIRREVEAAGKSSQTKPLVGFYFANFCAPDMVLLPITPRLRQLFLQALAVFENSDDPRLRKLLRKYPLLPD